MRTTMRNLKDTYGLREPTAYRVMAELSSGASMSTALLNGMHQPGTTPPIYGGLFLPPSAYARNGSLLTCMCPTQHHA